MKNKYQDIIHQSHDMPHEIFSVEDNNLFFHKIDLMKLVEQYGSPLKLSFLPKISSNIQFAKKLFNKSIQEHDYKGSYNYCYCTKSSHFSFVLDEALKNDIHLETSSGYDINLIENLVAKGKFTKDRFVICNGFKLPNYITNIARVAKEGYNIIPVLDNKEELEDLENAIDVPLNIGIRIATEEFGKTEFYTSRLGIGSKSVVRFANEKIMNHDRFKLKMLHFFINTGVNDSAYYWNELAKCVKIYCDIKKFCPSLDSLNIGGGMPIMKSLDHDFDHAYMIGEIVAQIKQLCVETNVEEPNIFTEFGSFTVGESGAAIFQVVNQKKQNDREKWNMIDSSFMTTIPDHWAISTKFILLPINKWDHEYESVILGGVTCDGDDFYSPSSKSTAVYLPKYERSSPLYIGFFHTGAYQESLGGYGGIQHCLTPAPKHILIQLNDKNELESSVFAPEQSHESMMKVLGYQ